ncbi:HNH endonuclease-domain-containing protein [Peziza echinospora]|nr:HNH endonuclease-domain-containing protein [Peziza echinospora]
MASNRSHFRNVHFYDGSNPSILLGGLIQNGSVTEANFLQMLGIVLAAEAIRAQHRSSGHIVSVNESRLELGSYDIYCNGDIRVSDELWVHRVQSFNVSGRLEDAFRTGIRNRDGRCVITGIVNRMAPYSWSLFEAAHIFPLGAQNLWIQWNYARWVTDMDDTVGVSKINSCQNGMLLRKDIHGEFDQYLVSVNPDDGYKVIVFGIDMLGIDGKTLDFVCRDSEDPHKVSDELLRWHFRQSVLGNMRGAGEPVFEHDFPPGTDMVKEIFEGPYAKERFELELSARLQGDSSRESIRTIH